MVLHPVPVHSPWYHVGIDFVGPIHPTSAKGNRFILTLSDYFTKWVEAIPLPTKGSLGVAQSLYKVFMRMGLPKLLTSDQGREFRNGLDKQIMELLNIKRHFITPYHPQANGLDERWNQTLKQMLVKYCAEQKEEWDSLLDPCVFAYNTAKHESTLHSPFELMFGRKAVIPVEIDFEPKSGSDMLEMYNESTRNDASDYHSNRHIVLQNAKQNIQIAQQKQKEQYDRKHSIPCKYKVGDNVLKKDFRRKKRKGGCLDHKWLGPYEVIRDVGKGFLALRCTESGKIIQRVHGAHLKFYNVPEMDVADNFTQSNYDLSSDLEDADKDSIAPLSPPLNYATHNLQSQMDEHLSVTDLEDAEDDSIPPLPLPLSIATHDIQSQMDDYLSNNYSDSDTISPLGPPKAPITSLKRTTLDSSDSLGELLSASKRRRLNQVPFNFISTPLTDMPSTHRLSLMKTYQLN
jgi:hypothetical protein